MDKLPAFQSKSRLSFRISEDDVIISCRGAGLSFGVILGLAVWGMLALGGLALFMVILVAPIRAGKIEVYNYLFALGVALVPVGIGYTFLLQSFRSGWNHRVVTISSDRIAVRYEGKLASSPYSFPLSQIKKIGICHDNQLHIMFSFRDYRQILSDGSEEELEWVEKMILERMQLGGRRCGNLENW